MEIKLYKKPKSPLIIEGFPGFGLVGTIATEFLLEHLQTEQIGKISFEEMPALVAIHEGKLVEPLGIFYNQKHNIVFLHAVTASVGMEWKLADIVMELSKQLNATEIISIECVGTNQESNNARIFYYTNNEKSRKKFESLGISPMQAGIIIGVTGAVLVKAEKTPISCIFAETHSSLPDSNAAAKAIEVLDKYLGLKVDYKPLLEQAEKFEEKLRSLLSEGQKAQELSDKKKLSYVG